MNKTYQKQVMEFVSGTFGLTVAHDKKERAHRFIEEALELAQISDCTKEEAHQLVEYVFSRPAGEIMNEVGGVCVTFTALANAHEIDVKDAGNDELKRCFDNQEKIREKFENKPKMSPLPVPVSFNDRMTYLGDGSIIITGEIKGLGENTEPGKVFQLDGEPSIQYLVPKVFILFRVMHDPFRIETVQGLFFTIDDALAFYETQPLLEEWEETKLPLVNYPDREHIPSDYEGHTSHCNHFWICESEIINLSSDLDPESLNTD